MQFSPVFCYLLPLMLEYLPQHPRQCEPLNVPDQMSRSCETSKVITVLYILIFTFLGSKGVEKQKLRNTTSSTFSAVTHKFSYAARNHHIIIIINIIPIFMDRTIQSVNVLASAEDLKPSLHQVSMTVRSVQIHAHIRRHIMVSVHFTHAYGRNHV